MRVVGGKIIENKISAVSSASGMSGAITLTIDGQFKTIHAKEAF
jgi:hypothetical protein